MKKLTLILLIALLPLLGFSSVFSQTDGSTVGLSLSPAIVEVAGDPGSKYDAQVIVTNTSEKAIPITVDAASLIPIDDVIDKERQAEFDASSWITLDEKQLLLTPGATATINAKVDIPKEANPGGHYAQIGFRVVSDANYDPNTNAQIIPELSAALFITVSGEVDEKAELITDNLISSYVNKGSTAKLSFTIRNTGNVHILPAPKITIFNEGGDIKQINMQPQLVLPNTQKQFTVDWPVDVAFGKYSARVETIYGSQAIPLSNAATEFRVGPAIWQIVLVTLLFVGIISLLLRRKNLPNAFKVLRGKRIHLVGKKRYSKARDNDLKQKSPSVGDYDAIADFLGKDEKPTNPLIKPPVYPINSAEAKPAEIPTEEIVIGEAMQKNAEEPLSTVEVSPKTSLTEFDNPDNPKNKTVIVQTSASTIIRQEPKQEKSAPEPKPTIVRKDDKKPSIKISIKDAPDEPVKKPTRAIKPKPPSTRSEKVAKKAAIAERKAKKKII